MKKDFQRQLNLDFYLRNYGTTYRENIIILVGNLALHIYCHWISPSSEETSWKLNTTESDLTVSRGSEL